MYELKSNSFAWVTTHTEAGFAERTVVWFRKFHLGHFEEFAGKIKVLRTWLKKFILKLYFLKKIIPRIERIWQPRTYIYLVTGIIVFIRM